MAYKLHFIANKQVIFQESIDAMPIKDLQAAAQDILNLVNSVEHPCYLLTDTTNLKATETNLIRIRDIYKPLTEHPRFMSSVVFGSNDAVALNFVMNTLSKILRVNAYVAKFETDAIAHIISLAPHLDGILQGDLKRLREAISV